MFRFGNVVLFDVGIVNFVVELVFLIDFVFELFMDIDDVFDVVLWFDLFFNLIFVKLLVFFLVDIFECEFVVLGLNCVVDFVVLDCLNFFKKLFFSGLLDFVDMVDFGVCDLGLLYEFGIDLVWLFVVVFLVSEFRNFCFVDCFEFLDWEDVFLIYFFGVFVLIIFLLVKYLILILMLLILIML